MVSQARAEATRQKIIDSSIELFREFGFSGTNLKQIHRKSGVSAGAFYYHFNSKEEVAFAVIDQVAVRMAELRNDFVGTPESGLENVILMAFQLSWLIGQDVAFWTAAYLEQAMARLDKHSSDAVAGRVQLFVDAIAATIQPSELRAGVTPEQAARTMVTVIYGCFTMSDLIKGDTTARVVECWRILLPGLVAPDSLSRFESVLSAAAARYRGPGAGNGDLLD
ncbi:MAG: TetR/AcrR family transcriptional regulator [Mycobacterium sp.]|nr:TetR/AcrR family transcriptional regulator [Mycobacterium sp.]